MNRLDDPSRGDAIRTRILEKPALNLLYRDVYARYAALLARCPCGGGALEIGSGAGFAREVVPELITSDILPYRGLDVVFDARRLPFGRGTLRAIMMFNVFHHVPDAGALLAECDRVLMGGGRMLIVDQHPGIIAAPILRHAHREGFDAAAGWTFASSGPLSGANGALSWIVFRRDRAEFERRFPSLRVERYEPHTPLRYWLAGGLKAWTLLPRAMYGVAARVDHALASAWPDTGSFVDVEIVKHRNAEWGMRNAE
jgi:SAM-dependent methyltransferase